MSLTGCIRRRRQPTCRRPSSTSPPSAPQELQQVHIILLICQSIHVSGANRIPLHVCLVMYMYMAIKLSSSSSSSYNRVFHGSVGIGEVQGNLLHIISLVPFAEESRLNKFK